MFQRTSPDSHGKLRKTKNGYIEFVSGNRTIREPTQFTKRSDAAEFLKQHVADAMAGKIPLTKGVTYDDRAELNRQRLPQQRPQKHRRRGWHPRRRNATAEGVRSLKSMSQGCSRR
ncbi:MAG: hypothetical protein HY657_08980 [Acidobacteria bacterium]|nr:hypothetical protein [Acidobacteriota bacterium]